MRLMCKEGYKEVSKGDGKQRRRREEAQQKDGNEWKKPEGIAQGEWQKNTK